MEEVVDWIEFQEIVEENGSTVSYKSEIAYQSNDPNIPIRQRYLLMTKIGRDKFYCMIPITIPGNKEQNEFKEKYKPTALRL